MSGHGTKFGRQKEEAVVALLTQRNMEEAARSIHVSTKTLLRWQKRNETSTPDSTAGPAPRITGIF